jgi:hypothetical protein
MKMNIKIEVLKVFLFEFSWGYDKTPVAKVVEEIAKIEEPKKTNLLEMFDEKSDTKGETK